MHCARHIAKRKGKVKPNAYAYLEYHGKGLDTQEAETEVLVRSSNPKWNQSFSFRVPSVEADALGELSITVYDTNDKKKRKSHLFLGEVRFHMADYCDVKFDYTEPRKYRLQGRGKKAEPVKGDLEVKIGMILPGSNRKKLSKLKRAAGVRQQQEDMTTDELIDEAEAVADASHATSERALRQALETRRVGGDILDNLGDQGKQLQRIQNKVDDVDALQDQEEDHLREIESPLGALKNAIMGKKRYRNTNKKVAKTEEKMSKRKQHQRKKQQQQVAKEHKKMEKRHPKASETQPYQPDLSVLSDEHQRRVEETDGNIDQIGAVVQDMKELAVAIGDEIEKQQPQLETLTDTVLEAKDRQRANNVRLKGI